MADSPWPMPEVSTTIRSKPLILQEANTSGNAAEISVPVSRVASERMKILSDSIAFIRMRSPSNGTPARLRGRQRREIVVAGANDIIDHALQAQLGAVFGGIQPRHAVGHQFPDLGG